jgi:small subunit ribosomal protein S2
MKEIDGILSSEATNDMKKKEVSALTRRVEKLHRDLDGIAEMKKLPAALIVIDVCNELNAVREANKLNIPIVALVDTNGDPSLVEYPVATNDDAVKSVKIITDLFGEAIKVATEIHRKRAAEERDAAEAAKKIAQENAEAEAPKAPRKRAPKSEDGAAKAPRKRAPKKEAAAEEK